MAKAILGHVARAAGHSSALAYEVARSAERTRAEAKQKQRVRVTKALAARRLNRARLQSAVRAITMIIELAQTPEFQSLLRARKGSLELWGGRTSIGGGWISVGHIFVRTSELVFESRMLTSSQRDGRIHSAFPHIKYSITYTSFDAAAVRKVLFAWVQYFVRYGDDDPDDPYSFARLVRYLVSAGRRTTFNRLIRNAIST